MKVDLSDTWLHLQHKVPEQFSWCREDQASGLREELSLSAVHGGVPNQPCLLS